MAKFILGEKIEMSQVFKDDKVIPTTLIKAGPCFITKILTQEKDKYTAFQVGYGQAKHISKPLKGQLKDLGPFKSIREFRANDISKYKIGDVLKIDQFNPGEKVKITGFSKGKGFQGVVKRWGFHGAPKTHGTKHQGRMPGSIGATAPQRVFKGMKMGGRMGNEQVTVKNLEIIEVRTDQSLIVVKGAVPGRRGTLLKISNI